MFRVPLFSRSFPELAEVMMVEMEKKMRRRNKSNTNTYIDITIVGYQTLLSKLGIRLSRYLP